MNERTITGSSADLQSQRSLRPALALGILTAINLLNYLDRFLLPPLVPLISEDLKLTDEEAGWLGSAFLLVYSFASPVFGRFGDQKSRPFLIFIGVLLWSLATAAAGFAVGLVSLFIARALVGVGEASYGTIAPAMLSDFYPKEQREKVMALFFVAIPVGASLGYIVGGGVAAAYNWRVAFWVAGFPGVLLAFAALLLRDPPRGGMDDIPQQKAGIREWGTGGPAHGNGPRQAGSREHWRNLLHNRTYWYIVAGYVAYTFAMGAGAYWLPTFVARERGIPLAQASQTIGVIAASGGIIGTLLGGWLASRLRDRIKNANLWVSGIGALAAAPLMWITLEMTDLNAIRVAFFFCEVLLFMSTGPIGAALVNAVEPSYRATGQAIAIFLIHMLGDVISPPIIGRISDQSSLGDAMLLLPPVFALGGLIWCVGGARIKN